NLLQQTCHLSVDRLPTASEIQFDHPAENVPYSLTRIEGRIRHLIDQLDPTELIAGTFPQRVWEDLATKRDAAFILRQEPANRAGKRTLATSRCADDGQGLTRLDQDGNVIENACAIRITCGQAINSKGRSVRELRFLMNAFDSFRYALSGEQPS